MLNERLLAMKVGDSVKVITRKGKELEGVVERIKEDYVLIYFADDSTYLPLHDVMKFPFQVDSLGKGWLVTFFEVVR